MAKTKTTTTPKINFDALIMFLTTHDNDPYSDIACFEAVRWLEKNKKKDLKWLWDNLEYPWKKWLLCRLGFSVINLDNSDNAFFENIQSELAKRLKKYTPDKLRRMKENRKRAEKLVKGIFADAKALVKRAEKIGLVDELNGLEALKNDLQFDDQETLADLILATEAKI
jgi:hypothetical protein